MKKVISFPNGARAMIADHEIKEVIKLPDFREISIGFPFKESHLLDSMRYSFSLIEKPQLKGLLGTIGDDVRNICNAYNYPSHLLKRQLNLQNMDDNKLDEINRLRSEIAELKGEIEVVKNTHCCSQVKFQYDHSEMYVSAEYVNFASLKKQVLANMARKLKEMERKYAAM